MPYSSIDKPSKYFNTVLYTGTGSAQSITGVGFKPDLVYGKSRSSGTLPPTLVDAVRGSNLNLYSNLTNAEENNAQILTSFNSDGFSVGTDTVLNSNGATFVAWNWLGANTTVSNTSGTITSTVSASQTSGFSIVRYTGNGTAGATVGHGLGVAPKMIIVKNRSSAGTEWITYHASIGNGKYLALQSTAGQAGTVTIWGTSASTFTLAQAYGDYNGNGNSHIAYCFADVKGFSKFGSYTGNGSANGTFVYTGFKPAFLLIKRTDTLSQWRVWDNKRNTFNVADTVLLPNDSGADTTNSSQYVDLLSNGFKWRATYVDTNASGGTFIYMAFAESPFVSSKGIPCTAR
jgi:hypothetical protein